MGWKRWKRIEREEKQTEWDGIILQGENIDTYIDRQIERGGMSDRESELVSVRKMERERI